MVWLGKTLGLIAPLIKYPLRARPNGEQNLKTKPETNEQTSELRGETRVEYKRRIRVTNKSYSQKRKRVKGRGGAPALMMHRPVAVEAASSPEKRGECAHTASQPYSAAAARAPLS